MLLPYTIKNYNLQLFNVRFLRFGWKESVERYLNSITATSLFENFGLLLSKGVKTNNILKMDHIFALYQRLKRNFINKHSLELCMT
jgi:hypothetical protein